MSVERFLGIRVIFGDNAETWTVRSGLEGRKDRQVAFAWYYLAPSPAFVFVFVHYSLRNVGQILAGVAVFTGLLFGLLILMFNTGLALRKDGDKIVSAHDLRGLVGAIRANATYAALVAMALAVTLVIAASTSNVDGQPHWGFTPIVIYLFVHLGLCLLTILRRLRTAFNYITR